MELKGHAMENLLHILRIQKPTNEFGWYRLSVFLCEELGEVFDDNICDGPDFQIKVLINYASP